MGEYSPRRLDAAFHALAHPTRRAILERLRRGGARVTDLAGSFSISLNTVSKHIKVLERSRLVERRVRGREHHVRLSPAPLRDVSKWVARYEEFWSQRLDALEGVLRQRRGQQRFKSGIDKGEDA